GIARPGRARLAFLDQTRDLGTALEARIHEPRALQAVERRPIGVEVLRLPPHRLLPGKPGPGQGLVDRGLVSGRAARRLEVLAAQQKPAAALPRAIEVEQRRERMTEMQVAVRAGREAEDGRHGSVGGRWLSLHHEWVEIPLVSRFRSSQNLAAASLRTSESK